MAMATSVWHVQWRQPQTKMHKTWDGDGWLIIKGTSATLRNEDDGKIIGVGNISYTLKEEDELKVGGKDCGVEYGIPYTSYLQQIGILGQESAVDLTFAEVTPPVTHAHRQLSSRRPTRPLVALPFLNGNPRPPLSNLIGRERMNPLAGGKPLYETQILDKGKGKAVSGAENGVGHQQNTDGPQAGKRAIHAVLDEEEEDDQDCSRSKRRGKDNTGSGDEEDSIVSLRSAPKPPRSPSPQRRERGLHETQHLTIGTSYTRTVTFDLSGTPDKSSRLFTSLRPTSQSSLPIVVETRYYTCQWRQRSSTKTRWEGDGILVIKGSNGKVLDPDTAKEITSGRVEISNWKAGQVLAVGSKMIEIDGNISEGDFLSGSVLTPVLSTNTTKFSIPALTKPSPFVQVITPNTRRANRATGDCFGKACSTRISDLEGAIVLPRPTKEHEARFNPKNLTILDVAIAPKIAKLLRPHQIEGVRFLYECVMGLRTEGQGCILADEMGLGKTIQAIALIHTLLRQNPYAGIGHGSVQRAMIVCPVTLIDNWRREIKKWLGNGVDGLRTFVADAKQDVRGFVHGRTYEVLIIGYERLRTVISDIKSAQPPIDLIICDEGHRLKSSEAQITQALMTLSTARRIILSGTPIQNDLSEFHTMVDFINPGILDSYTVFKKVFESTILRSREPNASPKDRKLGQARTDQLNRISKAFVLRRTNGVISKYLTPKLEYTVFIIPTKLEIALYNQILAGTAVKDLLNGAVTQQLSILNVLRRLCNTPGLLMKDLAQGKSPIILNEALSRIMPSNGDPNDFALSGKLLALGSLLAELCNAGEEKIVIVSNFTSTLDIVEKHCNLKRYRHCRLDGQTPQKDRPLIVETFNKGSWKTGFIFLLSSKSGGTGLNIIGASRLILVDSDWNPSTDLQAMARIHRQGQMRQCVLYRFLTAGTMDEKIYQRQVTKLGLSGALMDDQTTAGVSKADAFTLEELKSIFQPYSSVACQTHDLLGCRCHLKNLDVPPPLSSWGSEPDLLTSDDLYDGFAMASQLPAQEHRAQDHRENLSLLKEWAHHDCSDENSIERIDDLLLRHVIYDRIVHLPDSEIIGRYRPPGEDRIPLGGGQISFAFAKELR